MNLYTKIKIWFLGRYFGISPTSITTKPMKTMLTNTAYVARQQTLLKLQLENAAIVAGNESDRAALVASNLSALFVE